MLPQTPAQTLYFDAKRNPQPLLQTLCSCQLPPACWDGARVSRVFFPVGNLVLGAKRQRHPGRLWLVSPPVMFLIQLLFSPQARCENQHCTAGPQCGHHAQKRRSPIAKGWHWWQGYQPAFLGEALSPRTLGILPPLLSCHH